MNKKIIIILILIIAVAVLWVFLKDESGRVPGTSTNIDSQNLTDEQKLDILEDLKAQNDSGPVISDEEKLETLEKLKAQTPEDSSSNQLSDEEKLKILESLKAQ